MGFEVDRKSRGPKDLWDLHGEENLVRPVKEEPVPESLPAGKPATGARTQKGAPQTKRSFSGSRPGTVPKSRKSTPAAAGLLIIICALVIIVPAGLTLYSNYRAQREAVERAQNPAIRNTFYMDALCSSLLYPDGMTFSEYTAQSLIEPYSLTIHLKGTAATSQADYGICARAAMQMLDGLGTVTFIEDDTDAEYRFTKGNS